MKIGIVTTTFENYGTRLQNLATVELLKEQYKKAKIETIVISIGHSKLRFLSRIFGNTIISWLYLRLKFKGKINRNNKLLHYRAFFLKTDSLSEYKTINERYDLIVVGSDQVWKHYSYLTNFKFALFSKNKICNAPSFPSRNIDKTDFVNLRPLISTFSSINFREQYTVDYFRENGIECLRLDDPTLRLPLSSWERLVKANKKHFSFFIYILNDKKCYDKVVEDINRIEKRDSIMSIFLYNTGKDKFVYSPLEFLAFLKNSDFIITNSFHGACFAKKFGKKLKIVNDKLGDPNDARFDIFLSYSNLVN